VPPVVHPVNVGDWHFGKFFFRDTFQAPDVDAIHLSDWGLISNTESTDATVPAKEVLILPCVEEVLSHFVLARQQAETLWLSNRYPEPVSPTDGAVAPVRTSRQIEISLEPNRPAMTTADIGLQHARGLCVAGRCPVTG